MGDRVALTCPGNLPVRILSTWMLCLFEVGGVRLVGGCNETPSSGVARTFSALRFPAEASSMRILRTLMASLPKLKNEKKYCDS